MTDNSDEIEFQRLFTRLCKLCNDDIGVLRDMVHNDESVLQLANDLLKVAGTIQKSERFNRDLYKNKTGQKFILQWRDFESRFSSTLLAICHDLVNRPKFFSYGYYSLPAHWHIVDLYAISSALALDATILFAEEQGQRALENTERLNWQELDVDAMPSELREKFIEVGKAHGDFADSRENLFKNIHQHISASSDEQEIKKYFDCIRHILTFSKIKSC